MSNERDFDAEYRAILEDNARRVDTKRWIAEHEAKFAPYDRRSRIACVLFIVVTIGYALLQLVWVFT